MKSQTVTTNHARHRLTTLLAIAGFIAAGHGLFAADSSDRQVEWAFKSGLDKASFTKSFKELSGDGYRIVDIESYRSGRSATASTVWAKLKPDEMWKIEMSLPITEFLAAHKKHEEAGFALVEFEADRTGATLHFSGIWSKTPDGKKSEFYFGMESLEFSNRYGEMSDRGFRMIDFEAYDANGKTRHSGVWAPKDTAEVRFYRGIDKNKFSEVASKMAQGGFRLTDIEGYQYGGDFVFAGSWALLSEGQHGEYAFDLLADEFYNKNATFTNDGYRMTEFEVYEDNGIVYYAGSWLKGAPNQAVLQPKTPEAKAGSMSLEAFRSNEKK